MKLHSYPWYADDWYGKETWLSMSCEERGIYRELLDHCYQEGDLPNDQTVLQKRCGASDDEWQRSSIKPLSHFKLCKGRLTHRKVNEIRGRLIDFKSERREAGRKGGKAKSKPKAELKPSLVPASSKAQTQLKPDATANSSVAAQTVDDFSEMDTLSAIAARINSRHPHPQLMAIDAITRVFADKTKPHEDAIAVALEIERNHARLCDLPEESGGWKGKSPRWLRPLRDFMANARDPTTTTKPTPTPEERPREFIG